MPTISMFYGILISMYVFDTEKHHLPHIHVRYNEFNASINIPEIKELKGPGIKGARVELNWPSPLMKQLAIRLS